MSVVISRRAGGIRKLSELEIDIDKDWNNKDIFNLGSLSLGVNEKISIGGILELETIAESGTGRVKARDILSLMSRNTIHLQSMLYTVSVNQFDVVALDTVNFTASTINIDASVVMSHNQLIGVSYLSTEICRLEGISRPTAEEGVIYYDAGDSKFYGYNGTGWVELGGGISKLSELEIDTDKNWQGYGISNLGDVSINDFRHLRLGSAIDVITNGNYANISIHDRLRLQVDNLLEISSGGNAVFGAGSFQFITEFGNFLFKGNGANVFRIENLNDPEWHVVDSLYEDSLVKTVGTRWAFLDGSFDRHIGVGITKFKGAIPGVLAGMVSNMEFGLYSPLPYNQRQGINIVVNPSNFMVDRIDIRVANAPDVTEAGGVIGILDAEVNIPVSGREYPSGERWILLSPSYHGYSSIILNSPSYYGGYDNKLIVEVNPFVSELVCNFYDEAYASIMSDSNGIRFTGTKYLNADTYWLLDFGISDLSGIYLLMSSYSGKSFMMNIFGDVVEFSSDMPFVTTGNVNVDIGGSLQIKATNGVSYTGGIFDVSGVGGLKVPFYVGNTEPNIPSGCICFWRDTNTGVLWLIFNDGISRKKVQLT